MKQKLKHVYLCLMCYTTLALRLGIFCKTLNFSIVRKNVFYSFVKARNHVRTDLEITLSLWNQDHNTFYLNYIDISNRKDLSAKHFKCLFKTLVISFDISHELWINQIRVLQTSGETTAGKSSFLNLLFNMDGFLPTSTLSCTSVITTIRYGEKRTARIIYMNTDKPDRQLDLEADGIEEFRKHTYLSQDRDKNHGIKEVCVTVPSDLLKVNLNLNAL